LIASFEIELEQLLNGDERQGGGDFHKADRLLFDDLKLSSKQLRSSIFTGEEEVFAFRRAISRLVEMQGIRWIGSDIADKIKKIE
jgi:peroxisome-assembly ATPase